MSKLTPFHVAIPVYDLEEARQFYREVLGCPEGRSSDQWTDFNLFGHQFVIHLKPRPEGQVKHHTNPVDGHDVPVPHYGVVLEWDAWHDLEARLRAQGIRFIMNQASALRENPASRPPCSFSTLRAMHLSLKRLKI
jgi:extradiol dioxygenase family protein